MSGERLSMRKIREVLRLRLDHGLPQRTVAQSLGLSQGAVHVYVARARRAGLSWPLPRAVQRYGIARSSSRLSMPARAAR
jgi:predicted transcriptional regulator